LIHSFVTNKDRLNSNFIQFGVQRIIGPIRADNLNDASIESFDKKSCTFARLSYVNLILLKSSLIVNVIIDAIPAHNTITPNPKLASISAHYNTINERQNPKACADINKKPVQTVSS
jgi:hypothetical protein